MEALSPSISFSTSLPLVSYLDRERRNVDLSGLVIYIPCFPRISTICSLLSHIPRNFPHNSQQFPLSFTLFLVFPLQFCVCMHVYASFDEDVVMKNLF